MTQLHQIIAIEKSEKASGVAALTRAHHTLAKPALMSGIARTYRDRRDEDGDELPSESTRVQVRADAVIAEVVEKLIRMYDVVATKENSNRNALADVVVDGDVILKDMPVTVLLFLEKQLVDLRTFVQKLPVLDQSEQWTYDTTTDAYATEPVQTTRTKKVPKAFVRAPATQHHQAVVDAFHEDVIVGTWTTVKFSGALPASRVKVLVERVEAMQRAVKTAREAANSVPVVDMQIGKKFFDYLFAA
jgi:hypothetical protein